MYFSLMWRLTVYDLIAESPAPQSAPGRHVYEVDGAVWLCEAAPADAALLDPRLALPVFSQAVTLAGAQPWLFRVDRIDLSGEARTPRHFHRGPGIRRLIFGRVRVEIGDAAVEVGPGGAWFEPGDVPVVGANGWAGLSAFLRISLLPVELLGGKSSFVPVSAAEAEKPRAVTQHLVHEAVLEPQSA